MNRQQQYLLKLLKEIHELCVRNDITYFIGMGTLIGAVRNEGFLPWDDDADLLMTYDNWQKFKEVCKTQLPANRYLGSPDTEESYGHLLPRYVSRETTTIHTSQSLHDDVAGEIIDIFVLDPIADGQEAYRDYLQDMYLYSSLANYANAAASKVELDPNRFKKYLDRMKSEGRLPVMREIEEMLASHFDDRGSSYAFRWQGVPILFERSWFASTVTLKFEDCELLAPKGINEFLTCYYGEEWPEVPGYINPAKHNVAASLDFPYTEALEYFKPEYDRDQLLKETEERRLVSLQNAPINNWLKDEKARARSEVVAAEIDFRLDSHRSLLMSAMQDGDAATLAVLLEPYLTWQTDIEMIGRHSSKGIYRYLNPQLVPVTNEVFEAGLIALMGTKRITHASRLLRVRRQLGWEITDAMAEVENAIAELRSAMDDYQYGRYGEGERTARSLVGRYPFVAYYLKIQCMHLWQLYKCDSDECCLDRFKSAVDEGLERFPGDGFFEKLEADYLAEVGEADGAHDLYLKAAERTRNGLALLGIFKATGYHPSWLRNPRWAKQAGVAQWNGPMPSLEGMPTVRPKPVVDILDSCSDCLLRLAAEVADVCKEAGIDYVLGPSLARAINQGSALPFSDGVCALICRYEDMARLANALSASKLASRSIEVTVEGEDDGTGGIPAIRYYCLESLYFDLKARTAPSRTSLHVSIVPAGIMRTGSALRFLTRIMARSASGGSAMGFKEGLFVKLAGFAASAARGDMSVFEDRVSVFYRGHEFWISTCYDKVGGALGLSETPAADEGAVLRSGCVSYGSLLAKGLLGNEFFTRKKQVRKLNRRDRVLLKRFQTNFRQIKLAVRLKEISTELLARKTELLDMASCEDWDALRVAMSSYLKCAKKFEGAGNLKFDDDLYRLLLEVQKHS